MFRNDRSLLIDVFLRRMEVVSSCNVVVQGAQAAQVDMSTHNRLLGEGEAEIQRSRFVPSATSTRFLAHILQLAVRLKRVGMSALTRKRPFIGCCRGAPPVISSRTRFQHYQYSRSPQLVALELCKRLPALLNLSSRRADVDCPRVIPPNPADLNFTPRGRSPRGTTHVNVSDV